MAWLPLLRLFQISDLHLTTLPRRAALMRIAMQSLLVKAPSAVQQFYLTGIAGHDRRVLRILADSVADEAAHDTVVWPKSLLAATGDVSTFGDDASIQLAHDYVHRLQLRIGAELFVLYGNHDVWPGDGRGPWAERNARLDQRRTRLRQQFFPQNWPVGPIIAVPFQAHGGALEIHSLNTILHDRVSNTVAAGHVRNDRYWERLLRPDQLDAFERGSSGPGVRVVVTHHPVHHPAAWPGGTIRPSLLGISPAPVGAVWNGIRNAQRVATRLSSAPKGHPGGVQCQLVVSGHTHETFPSPGNLPATLPLSYPEHDPLLPSQAQLIAGTACQTQGGAKPLPNAWQVLRFYENDSAPEVLVERIVFERQAGEATFRVACNPHDPEAHAERMVVPIR